MARTGDNDIDENGVVRNGYDYDLQVWVTDYIIEDCGHTDTYRFQVSQTCCNAHKYRSEDIREVKSSLPCRIFK